MDLKNINFTDFVRYFLTGLNFILFVLILPTIYLAPDLVLALVSDASIITVLLLSLAIGYLMDMLKLYQFAPNFNTNKVKFRRQIAEILEVSIEEAGSYFSITSKLWDQYSTYSFERRRAEWMLILHTAAALFISMVEWILIFLLSFFQNGFTDKLYIPITVIVVTLLLVVRLYRVGFKEIAKDDREFLLIMQTNKKKIKNAWEFKEID